MKKTVVILLFSAVFMAALLFTANAYAVIKTGILPYKIISQNNVKYSYLSESIPALMSESLSSGEITVARNADLDFFVKNSRLSSYSTPDLSKISNHFGLDFLVFGRVIKIGKEFVVQSSVYSTSKNMVVFRTSFRSSSTDRIINKLTNVSGKITDKIESLSVSVSTVNIKNKPSQPEEPVPAENAFIKRFNGNTGGLTRTASLGYVIHSMAVGRILKKGIQAVIVSKARVILYNLSVNGNLSKIAKYGLKSWSNPVYVGIYRISPETKVVVLTLARLGMIKSFLLSFQNGKLSRITPNYNLFLRIMNINGRKVLVGQEPVSVIPSGRYFNDYVIGQTSYPIGQFGGKTYIYKFSGAGLEKTEEIPFLEGMTLYGTAYGNIKGDGNNYLLALSNSGKLMLVNGKGNTVYTGTRTYGGSPLRVKVPSFNGSGGSTDSEGLIYNVPAQLELSVHKGKTGVIVIKNYNQVSYLRNLSYYTKSSIYKLKWNRIGFYPVWELKPVTGYSAGFSTFKSKGILYLADAVVKNPGSMFSKPESYIIIYKIGHI